ncbi:MAG: hypothetical protein ACRDHO_06065 [Actinomycetota bacterium]
MRYGTSYWKASRWIGAAHALQELPLLSQAFASGDLGMDKVVELTLSARVRVEAHSGFRTARSGGSIRTGGDTGRDRPRLPE